MKNIKQELLELNFNVNSIGLLYWIEAIKIYRKNKYSGIIELYEDVAKKFNATKSKVERGMRTAILPARENIQNKYHYYNKIKNKTFLNLITYGEEWVNGTRESNFIIKRNAI